MSNATWNSQCFPDTLSNLGYPKTFLPRYCTNSSNYCKFAAESSCRFAPFKKTKCSDGYEPAGNIASMLSQLTMARNSADTTSPVKDQS